MEMSEKIAACYCRKSSGVTRPEDSIESQKKNLAELAARKGMKPVFFIDNCSTGKHQTALRKLVKEVKAGRVEMVLVLRNDRISRSVVDWNKFSLLLKKHMVSLMSWETSKNALRGYKIRKGMMRHHQKMLLCYMLKIADFSIEEIRGCLNKIK